MKHKRKDRQFTDDSKQSTEQIQADHEAFLQVFEKPTQIYRFLRTRHLVHPCFMHRNLSYMKGRCLRKRNTRANFNAESLVEAAKKSKNETVRHRQMSFQPVFDSGMNLKRKKHFHKK